MRDASDSAAGEGRLPSICSPRGGVQNMYIEFGTIFRCPLLTCAALLSICPVVSCENTEGCSDGGELGLKNRTKLSLPYLWVLPEADFYTVS